MWRAVVLSTLSCEASRFLQPRPRRVPAREMLALSREDPLRAQPASARQALLRPRGMKSAVAEPVS